MAISQGLIDTYWRRYNQRRALTGLPSSYQEMRGSMDSMLDYELALKRKESDDTFRNRQLSLQEQAQKDSARAATVSGIAQTGGLLATGLLTNKALNNQTANTEMMRQYLMGGQGVGSAGVLPSAGAGSAVPMANAAPYSAAGPTLSYGAGGEVGAGLAPTASVASAAPSAASSMLGAAGPAAALYGAQYGVGKATEPWMREHGMKYTNMGWTYGGLPGAMIGAPIDIGKKVFDAVGDFASDIFG